MLTQITKWYIAAVVCCICASNALANKPAQPFVSVPETISEQAQKILRTLPDPLLQPELPAPHDIEGWKAVQTAREAAALTYSQAKVRQLRPTVVKTQLGGVPVLDVQPENWVNNGKAAIYTHGGAYTFFSAASTLNTAALFADATGLRVFSVDYTLAPHSKWHQTITQVANVFAALLQNGYSMDDLAIIGDSAGGGLAAASVLKMRDMKMGMPAAVVLWSPWSDITDAGDSYTTLKHADPCYRYDKHLKKSADAYADPVDQKHPYVSPVYADYRKGFPPTLIQGGTKEIFLSNFIRHYQALDTAGQTVTLDLYEGMTHVFQSALSDTPESQRALGKTAAFLKKHMTK